MKLMRKVMTATKKGEKKIIFQIQAIGKLNNSKKITMNISDIS